MTRRSTVAALAITATLALLVSQAASAAIARDAAPADPGFWTGDLPAVLMDVPFEGALVLPMAFLTTSGWQPGVDVIVSDAHGAIVPGAAWYDVLLQRVLWESGAALEPATPYQAEVSLADGFGDVQVTGTIELMTASEAAPAFEAPELAQVTLTSQPHPWADCGQPRVDAVFLLGSQDPALIDVQAGGTGESGWAEAAVSVQGDELHVTLAFWSGEAAPYCGALIARSLVSDEEVEIEICPDAEAVSPGMLCSDAVLGATSMQQSPFGFLDGCSGGGSDPASPALLLLALAALVALRRRHALR